jgi:hypothetical protein
LLVTKKVVLAAWACAGCAAMRATEAAAARPKHARMVIAVKVGIVSSLLWFTGLSVGPSDINPCRLLLFRFRGAEMEPVKLRKKEKAPRHQPQRLRIIVASQAIRLAGSPRVPNLQPAGE